VFKWFRKLRTMRVLQSIDLPLKQTLIYSYGRYRQQEGHKITPGDIARALHFTPPTVNKLLVELHNKLLVDVTQGQLTFAEPTDQHFRMAKTGQPIYFTMSLVIEGSANETAVLYLLRHLYKLGRRKQTSVGLESLLHLHRRNIERTIQRLEKKGLVKIDRNKDGFTILEVATKEKPVIKLPIAVKSQVKIEELPQDKVLSRPVPTWKDVAPDVDEGTPAYRMISGLLKSGLTTGEVKYYYDMSMKRYFLNPLGMEVSYWQVILNRIEDAKTEHFNNKGNERWGELFRWKMKKFLTDNPPTD